MRFTYCYKTSDNVRHEAEIDAPGRDEAFAALREKGIKPIKVEAADAGRQPRRAWPWILAATAVLSVGGGAWWAGRRIGSAAPYSVMTPAGQVTYTVAEPLPRQAIPGNRTRIEGGRNSIFADAGETLLSCYAEPGRVVDPPKSIAIDFRKCLKTPIRIASTDFTEVVDLKRIVTGMKLEMRAYLAGGGTVEQYLAELSKRQKLEISYRENAEKRLNEVLSRPRDAYTYWLKANAALRAMGIYPLALPDALQSYQMSLDIDSDGELPDAAPSMRTGGGKGGTGR